MKRFNLIRSEDVSGVSGTGTVAEGVQFSNGKVVVGFTGKWSTAYVYDSIEDVIGIHGHEGRTQVSWLDE